MTTRREIALAGFRGDESAVRAALGSPDAATRATAFGALDRMERLGDDELLGACTDPSPLVRLRGTELAAARPDFPLLELLDDEDALVAEMAAWACGEHEQVDEPTFTRLVGLATEHPEPLVREAAVASLGALGDSRGLPAVLAGTKDRSPIRRRAVIALVAFDGPQVDEALRTALEDRDWQVREAAEELLRDD